MMVSPGHSKSCVPGVFFITDETWRDYSMEWSFAFVIKSVLLGAGLAMDAFSVSLANGLNEPCMKKPRMCLIAGIFAFFQALMPLLGWLCIRTIAQAFSAFEKLIPWIALALLCFIGAIREGLPKRRRKKAAS